MSTTTEKIALCLIGGPTALIEIGGLRWLTDPTFDAPGHIASGTRRLTTTQPPGRPGPGDRRDRRGAAQA
jgi:L-ascorbate metabolism protein UlaG (beta-lactamase superfamily)